MYTTRRVPEKVAGGRSEAQTSGDESISFRALKGCQSLAPFQGANGSSYRIPVVFDHRLLSRSPAGCNQRTFLILQELNELFEFGQIQIGNCPPLHA